MNLKVSSGDILKIKSDATAIALFEGEELSGPAIEVDRVFGGIVAGAMKSGEFKGKPGETFLLHAGPHMGGGPARILLVGMGKREKFRPDTLRRAAGKAASKLRAIGAKDATAYVSEQPGVSIIEAAGLWTEGASLALYRFDEFKAKQKDKKELDALTLVVSDAAALKTARKVAESVQKVTDSVCFARDMINAPSNAMTPTVMAARAKAAAKETGFKLTVLEARDCAKLKMGAYLGVAQGSVEPPKFMVMEHHGGKKGARPVVLVGKAITFDSGGISIKPVSGMEKMKYDMAGGAAVIATMRAAAALKLPVNVVGIVPATENMPSGSAYKPGDVVRAMNGKTVEIISTDAEGRMVLADALCYSERFKPTAIVDIATLTGGCVVALGEIAIGLMGNDEHVIERLKSAGDATFERVWELPMWDEFLDLMKGDVSDLKNAAGRDAQTITAGKFLEEFVPKGTPWAHLDIAGTAWEEKGQPYIPKGARGTGVRLLLHFLTAGE